MSVRNHARLSSIAWVALVLLASPPAAHAQSEHAHDDDASASAADLPRTPRPADAVLYIIAPVDGETVPSPVTVRFGLRGMGVAPAGVEFPDTGHHHLLIDAALPPLDLPLPANEQNLHFGAGQTEVTLDLAPGRHELQLILGDKNHIPHAPPLLSDRITITVPPSSP
ncbi:DUF4399 domain-containing protein [Myxococcota bacterium]|nr:DUF4399 domain-containing protein [Myxococcota bacterium]MCZ7617705.1 DUF4399 domain-containing protein [Myxococcota bacterium]